MLVLSRKSQESVIIGGPDRLHRLMKVTVLDIQGPNVKLGFEVDSDVPVHRSEVWERINGNGHAGSRTRKLAAPPRLFPEPEQGESGAAPTEIGSESGEFTAMRSSNTGHSWSRPAYLGLL